MKNTKGKLKNQSKIVKFPFQQIDIASSLSITQTCLRGADKLSSAFVHCNISGNNIAKYFGLNTVVKYIHPVKLVSDLAKLFNGVNRQNIVKSISPLLVFVNEMKLLYHTWFRSWSAYISNGIVEFLKEVQSSWFISVPAKITKNGYQIEIKMYECLFIKKFRKILIGISRLHKNKESLPVGRQRGKHENQHKRVYGTNTFT